VNVELNTKLKDRERYGIYVIANSSVLDYVG
jgi:hypothetical protein